MQDAGFDGASWSWTGSDPDADPTVTPGTIGSSSVLSLVTSEGYPLLRTTSDETWIKERAFSGTVGTHRIAIHCAAAGQTIPTTPTMNTWADGNPYGSEWTVFYYPGAVCNPASSKVAYIRAYWGTTTYWQWGYGLPGTVRGPVPVSRVLRSTATCRTAAGTTTTATAQSASYVTGNPLPGLPAVVCPSGASLVGLQVVRAAADGTSLPARTLLSWSGSPRFGASVVAASADQIRGVNFPAGSAADPVNTATGALVDHQVDAALPGTGLGLQVGRTYNSDDTRAGLLGRGWRLSYEARLSGDLAANGNGTVSYEAGDGHIEAFTRQADGSYTAPAGIRNKLVRNPDGSFTFTSPDQLVTRFDTAGRLTSLADRNTNTVTFTYDAAGFLDRVSTSGRWIDFDVDPTTGLLSKATLNDGRWVGYSYTAGLLTGVRDLRGNTWTYAYDTASRLTSATDPLGHALRATTYGSDGRVATQADARGKVSSFAYDLTANGSGNVIMTDPRGGKWTDLYDRHVLVGRANPLNSLTSYYYNDKLQLSAMDAPGAGRTSFEYDTAGNLSRTVLPDGTSASSTYNARNDIATGTDPFGHTTTYGYDTAGNLTSVTTPDGKTATTTYDARGLPLETYAPGNLLQAKHTYDPTSGDLLAVEDGAGNKTTFGYDSAGRRTSVVEPRGNVAGADPALYTTHYAFNDADQLTSITSPLGLSASQTYDAAGRLTTVTDPKARTVSFAYDPAGHPTSVQGPDPAIAPVTSTYDDNGNLASRTDAKGRSATYTYDLANHLTTVTDPTGSVTRALDPAGRITAVTDQANRTTAFTRDVMGRVTTVDYPDATPDVTFTYDAGGRRASMTDAAGTVTYTYDTMSRLTAVTRGTDTFSYTWDDLGRLTSRTTPGQPADSFAYDSANHLATVSRGGSLQASFGYDPAGNPTTTSLANGVTETRGYDHDARLTSIEARNSATNTLITQALYTLDEAGNPTRIVDESSQQAFTYDTNTDRLTKVCYAVAACGSGETDWIAYTYDQVGNRLTETRPAGTTTFAYDPNTDRLTTTTGPSGSIAYGYDAVGNTPPPDPRPTAGTPRGCSPPPPPPAPPPATATTATTAACPP